MQRHKNDLIENYHEKNKNKIDRKYLLSTTKGISSDHLAQPNSKTSGLDGFGLCFYGL